MKKNIKIGIAVAIIAGIGVTVWGVITFSSIFNPLPMGQDPALELPYNTITTLDSISYFGLPPGFSYDHNGIDFGFNDTTTVVAPCAAIIAQVKFWYNERGGHWQTSLSLHLNSEWGVEMYFESWAANETAGQQQANAVLVKAGDRVDAKQTMGQLLYHGEGCHIHFGVIKSNTAVCPYNYWTQGAKVQFDQQFLTRNMTNSPCY